RLALCSSRTQWQRARASLAAPARAERGRRPGPAPEHPHWAGRAAHQPRRLPRKRTAGGIDPILLPQRVLRLRRRDATRREMTDSIQGAILTPFGWRLGELHHDGGRVVAINGRAVSEAEARASAQPIVLPGFIDLHVHGGGGHD